MIHIKAISIYPKEEVSLSPLEIKEGVDEKISEDEFEQYREKLARQYLEVFKRPVSVRFLFEAV